MIGLGQIIAFSGTHGTGKSTAVYEWAAELKKTRGGEVGVILETARACPFPICAVGQATEKTSQLWIFSAQIQAELHMVQRYPVTVSDRSVVDCIAYTSAMGWTDLAGAMLQVIKSHMAIYERIVFRSVNRRDYFLDDGFRDQDAAFRLLVEGRLLELYERLKVPIVHDIPN